MVRRVTGPGLVVLFGSGETSTSGRRVYDRCFRDLAPPVRVAVLETPAGFQPNSALVAEKVAEYIRRHLPGRGMRVEVVAARRRGTPHSPDDPAVVAPMLDANALFLGPGSPTYAVRQLRGSLAWEHLIARHRAGAAVILASAATIAAGAIALPVYEIYKAGEDPHWISGLDLFGAYGLPLVFVPHWNNREGGAELDTSRCFMGEDRFDRLLARLDLAALTVVGIDEHTALVVDPAAGTCQVMGTGGVTVLRQGYEERFPGGQSFHAGLMGPFQVPERTDLAGTRRTNSASDLRPEQPEAPPPEIAGIVEERELARARRDWPTADALRRKIEAEGWTVEDTRRGPVVKRVTGTGP
jgi:cyanophycinase-like exopeptidase